MSLLALALIAVAAPAPTQTTFSGVLRLANGTVAPEGVVWLEGKEKGKPLPKAMMDQRDRTFIPHVMVVPAGTKVDFPNNDTVHHNVFADYRAARFDFGMYPKGTKREKLFDKPGLVVLLCSMHSEMSAFIMVVDTPYYAVADSKGRFSISGVPPGTYELHGWHEANQTYQGSVTVGAAPATVTVNLTRKRK